MAFDRFMIAPFKEGLEKDLKAFKVNASFGYNIDITKGGILKKDYKSRCDIIPMLGKTFNDLTVIAFASKGKYRGANWLCRCVCGREIVVPGGHLRYDMRKSCGCRSERFIEASGIKKIFSSYKTGAKKRNLTFELSLEKFSFLLKSNCRYCGSHPKQILKRQKSRKTQLIYNGIDRIDNKEGYTEENSVSCCMYCNRSKSDLTLQEWKQYIERIYKWLLIDG